MAKDTKRILLSHRSNAVEQPTAWGVWGGAIDSAETPENTVTREIKEETGYQGHAKLIPLVIFSKGAFNYYNYLAIVDAEFNPRLDWETQDFAWVNYGDWPQPIHFGLEYLIKHPGDKIQKIITSLS